MAANWFVTCPRCSCEIDTTLPLTTDGDLLYTRECPRCFAESTYARDDRHPERRHQPPPRYTMSGTLRTMRVTDLNRHLARRLRGRFDAWVLKHVAPQRPFITFDEGAEMGPVTITRDRGMLTIRCADSAQLRGFRTYDAQLRIRRSDEESPTIVENAAFVRRGLYPKPEPDCAIYVEAGGFVPEFNGGGGR